MPDFRLNKAFDRLSGLSAAEKDKVEFLCNECCWFGCRERKRCYEAVSRKNLRMDGAEHRCAAPGADGGYRFSRAMTNPGFIGVGDIQKRLSADGVFQFQNRRARAGERADSGIFAALHDPAGISAARPGGGLSG